MGQADSSTAPYFASTTLTAPSMRQAMSAVWADSPTVPNTAETGVITGGGNTNTGFVPTSNGSSSNPSVSVAPGQCVIQRPVGGTYVCTLPSAVTVTVTTPLPASGQTRIDVLCGSVVDGEADGGTPPQTNAFRLITVTGTAGSSPSVPSVPAGYLPLFNLTVNNAGALTIADVRTYTRGVGGMRFVAPGDVRAGSYPADTRVFATGQVDCWLNLTGTWGWVTIVAASVWTEVNHTWVHAGAGAKAAGSVVPGTGGTSTCRYKRSGNDLTVSYLLQCGTASVDGGAGSITGLLPAGFVGGPRPAWMPCHLTVVANATYGSVNYDISGMAVVRANSSAIAPFFPLSAGVFTPDIREAPLTNTDSTLAVGKGTPLINSAFPLIASSTLTVGPGTIEIAS